eukprot:TRINITY_DN18639_c0_g1_i1.p1 TRINITY_DN18639_c0_g1~~TRINITY_DN18639_c0_g1_i1.p1  ORF type:complete len:199 (+),score=55.69 TRINITY_DN18639_c0_g1_i1:170-766(+)
MATLEDFAEHLKQVNAGYDHIYLLHKDICEFDVNEKNWRGWTCMHHLADLCSMNYKHMSKLVLAIVVGFEGDLNPTDQNERIPLHWAAMAGNTSFIMSSLADFDEADRALVNAQDDKGRTPLHMAAIAGKSESVKMLVEFRADPTLEDSMGKKAYDYAKDAGIRSYLYLHREKPPEYVPYDEEEVESVKSVEKALETF